MYFWNYHALAKDFKEHVITSRDKFKYLLSIMIYVPTGLMGSNWIPGIYRLIYSTTNKILAFKAPQVPPLRIFNDYNFITNLATISIIFFGLLICYWTNRRGDGKNFIERFMCLSIPVSVRISTYVLIIFLITLSTSLIYFFFKLQAIANVQGFLKAFKQLKRLRELVPVMAYISFRMHIFSCVISIFSLLWSFMTIRREIKFISKP